MAAVPPTSTRSSQTTLTAGVQQQHPLKGIVNSNDDPSRCVACSVFMRDLGKVTVSFCCGRGVCGSCSDVERELKHCPQCNAPKGRSAERPKGRTAKEVTACLKKHSKKGHPWAQANLAGLYWEGNGIRKSLSEALHWNRQAAKRGNPFAMQEIGSWFLDGIGGCPVDLHQAQEYFEAGLKASKTSSAYCYEACREGLVGIALCHLRTKSFEKARTILLPLAEEGMGIAQETLGDAILQDYDWVLQDYEEGLPYHEVQNMYSSALVWYSSAAFALGGDIADKRHAEFRAALGAMHCSRGGLHKYAQAKFWARLVKKNLRHPEMEYETRIALVKGLVRVQRELRALRDICGGCGVEFEGKERKFCRGCCAVCYCSRECQKMHWNRKEGGHREDCKDSSELKQKMKENKKAEAIEASESK